MSTRMDEFGELLAEQLEWMDASCEAYDNGRTSESKRLAHAVRVLLHDTGASTSLATHLAIKDKLVFHDPLEEDRKAHPGMGGDGFVGGGLAVVELGQENVRYVPRFEVSGLGSELRPFEPWWKAPVIFPQQGAPPSRRNITLWLANKDGGSHADAALPPMYASLKSGRAMGWTFHDADGETIEASPVLTVMRGIAEEVRVAFRAASALPL